MWKKVPVTNLLDDLYFSSKLISNPRKLYYNPPSELDSYCNKLFKMSSVLPVYSPGFQILSQKYHWEMPKERACHLFFQVNHPDIINEFSEVLTDLINDENFFTNAFSSIYMNVIRDDQLMNQQSFHQNGEPICFAYACSCTIQLSLCRIFCAIFLVSIQSLIELLMIFHQKEIKEQSHQKF